MSDVINEKIQIWRAKCQDGTITLEEMREAIASIRKERVAAQETSTKSRTKKAAVKANEVIDSDGLLGELGL